MHRSKTKLKLVHPMGHRTPLYPNHVSSGAKLVDFAGWDMPLHYGSQIQEHQYVRQHVGMFDVSHMTVIDVSGEDANAFLRYLLANDVARLGQPGGALYSLMLNHDGGVVDDLIVYYLEANSYRLVVNSATREKDLAWIQTEASTFEVAITERNDLAIIALQGPDTMATLTEAIVQSTERSKASSAQTANSKHQAETLETLNKLAPFQGMFIELVSEIEFKDSCFIARTGYTGEDGVEIILPDRAAEQVWAGLEHIGVKPIGLGARDTLRLEAGLNLYGHEMDDETSPLEANLGWTIAWQPEDRNFIGRKAISEQRENGVASKLVGLVMTDKGVLRAGQTLTAEGIEQRGVITSGTYSPTLRCGVALARVPRAVKEQVTVEIRGKLITLQVVKPPFVRHGKKVYSQYSDKA